MSTTLMSNGDEKARGGVGCGERARGSCGQGDVHRYTQVHNTLLVVAREREARVWTMMIFKKTISG